MLGVQELGSCEQPARSGGALRDVLRVSNLQRLNAPFIDRRSRCGLETVYGNGASSVALASGGRTVGAVVDPVSNVVAVPPAQIAPAPAFNCAIDSGHMIAIDAVGEAEGVRMLIPVDIKGLQRAAAAA